VQGEPDVGKSALTLQAAAQLEAASIPVTLIDLGELPPRTLEAEALLGARLTDVMAATATGPVRLVVIDGAEAVLQGKGQVLGDITAAAFRAGMGVVVVTRSDAAVAARRRTADGMAAAEALGPVSKHEVPRLTGAEASQITATFSSLARLAAGPPRLGGPAAARGDRGGAARGSAVGVRRDPGPGAGAAASHGRAGPARPGRRASVGAARRPPGLPGNPRCRGPDRACPGISPAGVRHDRRGGRAAVVRDPAGGPC
jgi:hypothetical protein